MSQYSHITDVHTSTTGALIHLVNIDASTLMYIERIVKMAKGWVNPHSLLKYPILYYQIAAQQQKQPMYL